MEQVQKLLKRSGRKNIIFIIDDLDRNEDEINEKMLQLLAEISSIDGIICVIALNDKEDIYYRPRRDDKKQNLYEEIKNYTDIDKYIHLRIRIQKEKWIEYEKSVKESLIEEYLEISSNENRKQYMVCSELENTPSLFNSVDNYRMHKLQGDNLIITNQNDILMTLFWENFLLSDYNLGEFLEELICDYLLHCKEIQKNFTLDELRTKNYIDFDINTQMFLGFWFGYMINRSEEWDWIKHFTVKLGEYVACIYDFYRAVEHHKHNKKSIEFMDLYSVFSDYMKTEYPEINKNREEAIWSDFQPCIDTLLAREEQRKLLKLLNNRNYPECEKMIKNKIEKSANFYLNILILDDWIQYIRQVLNNYRIFKMQLREARIYNLNYIDYLLEEWPVRKELIDLVNGMAEHDLKSGSIPFNGDLKSFLNMVIYHKYVLNYGENLPKGLVEKGRIWIYYGRKRKLLVLSNWKNGNIENRIMKINGNCVEALEDREDTEIKKMAKHILQAPE